MLHSPATSQNPTHLRNLHGRLAGSRPSEPSPAPSLRWPCPRSVHSQHNSHSLGHVAALLRAPQRLHVTEKETRIFTSWSQGLPDPPLHPPAPPASLAFPGPREITCSPKSQALYPEPLVRGSRLPSSHVTCSCISIRTFVKSHLLREALQDYSIQASPPPPALLGPSPTFYFFPHLAPSTPHLPFPYWSASLSLPHRLHKLMGRLPSCPLRWGRQGPTGAAQSVQWMN